MKKTNLVLGLILIMLLAMSTGLMAANQVVTSTGNSGAGTLRQAIADVGDGETITFNISGNDVVIISSELSITTKGMTINGYNNATGNNVTVQVTTPGSGGTASRIFHINASGKTFNFSNMTIKGGDTSGYGDDFRAYGGGIFFEAGTLNLELVTISGAKAHHGGGILNRNTSPTLTNCTISDNIANGGYGGGIYNYGETGASSPTLTNCTINGNSAVTYGGGMFTSGISSGISSPILTNCTISGNSSKTGGGMHNYGHYCSPTLTNCTISGNNSTTGYTGGLYNDWSGLHIKNTIIANNSGSYADFYTKDASAITDNGYNLVENSHNWNWSATGDIYGEQANLNLRSTLADNGTLNGTKTLALYYEGSTASVAIDAGSNVANNGVAIPTTDQRGAERYDFTTEANVQSSTDIGAYEDWTGGDTATPITLSFFTATAVNGVVELAWETVTETNNACFIIYRNGEAIGSIDGAGTTTEPHAYTYIDATVVPGLTYTYVLADVDYANDEIRYEGNAVTVTANDGLLAIYFTIGAAYPNPFNPVTIIPLTLARDAMVRATLYDTNGREIKGLLNRNLSAGAHTISIDGSRMTTGLYLVQIEIDNVLNVQKIALMK
ncbi:MAG: choice-of-anchor Q domain-containing protein [Candidatus Marinimicrobia bacterium]|nr:choice-of-anchor Q domain-containing protein [Candidatus Neomarinimicrobiota bacterium]